MGEVVKTEQSIKKSINDNKNNANREYFISLEKIRKFKEKVMLLDSKSNIQHSLMLSPSPQKQNKQIFKGQKRKLQPIQLLAKSYNSNLKTEAEEMDKMIKKEESSPKKLPPITDSLYKRLLRSKNVFSNKDFSYSIPLQNEIMNKDPQDKNNNINQSPAKTSRDKKPEKQTHVNKTISIIKPKFKIKNNYIITPGNNKELIQKCMQMRNENWEEINSKNYSYANFIWTPLSYEIDYSLASKVNQIVNHFEFNSEISNKMKLFANLLRYCDITKKINIFSIFPLTIIIPLNEKENYFSEQLDAFKKFYNDIDSFIAPSDEQVNYNEYFKLIIYSSKIGANQKLILPNSLYVGKNLWLIKPVNMNRGRCIKIENDLNTIESIIKDLKSKKEIRNEKNEKIVEADYVILQKYIERPLLYKGRKFDIRLWVMLISDRNKEVFIFKEGHLKATCDQYSLDTNEPFVHLTNYSVQKHHKNFSKIEKGNEISFSEFKSELKNDELFNKIYNKITYIVRLTITSAKQRINLLNRRKCFEIFGYDFLIDEMYSPFLIEVNTNPGLEESSPLIAMLTPRMIDDALKLTIDVEYKNTNKDYAFHVDGYDDKENMWESFQLL